MQNISLTELKKFNGIGRVKAITLKAVGELIKRVERPILNEIVIENTNDVAKIIMPELRYETIEMFYILYIGTKGNVKKIQKIKEGSINSVQVDIKQIFKEAIKQDVFRIILAHNHPSGDPTPSREDIEFTKHIIEVGKILDIEVLDHLVIGDGRFTTIMKFLYK